MAIRDIIEIGHPILRHPTLPVQTDAIQAPEVQGLIDDLIETMRHANGAGLAANQIAARQRICVMEVSADNPRYPYKPRIPLTVMVNPHITPLPFDPSGDTTASARAETFQNYEGCLSVPNLRGMVPRARRIELRYYDRRGELHIESFTGLAAGTVQHEVDHLDGKLFVDRVEDPRTFCTWAQFKENYESDFIAYLHREALVG